MERFFRLFYLVNLQLCFFDEHTLSARFAALPYNMIFYVNSFEVDNNFMFGFNFVHFWLFLFFNKLIIEEKKLKTNL